MVNYRKARPDEITRIYQFETAYIDEIEPENLERWTNAEAKTLTQLESHIDKITVAEVAGNLAGHIYWNLHQDQPHIFSIYVLKDYRRLGIAKTLMTLGENDIQQSGFQECLLSTRVHNPAKRLFEVIGYQVVHRDRGWFHMIKTFQ